MPAAGCCHGNGPPRHSPAHGSHGPRHPWPPRLTTRARRLLNAMTQSARGLSGHPWFSLDRRGTVTSQVNPDTAHACRSSGADPPRLPGVSREASEKRSAQFPPSLGSAPRGRCWGGPSGGSPVGGQDPRSFPETLVFRACTEASMISAARETARLVGSGRLEKDRSCDGDGIPLWLRSLRHKGKRKEGYSSGAVRVRSQNSLQQSMCRACPCGLRTGTSGGREPDGTWGDKPRQH